MKIFLSYAKENVTQARTLFGVLKACRTFDIWFDETSLIPGQRWEDEITAAIKNSDLFLLLLSKHSTSKRGFVQKEIRLALSTLNEFPENAVYLIPIRLDDCMPHFLNLNKIHFLDLFPDWDAGIQKLVEALEVHRKSKFNDSILRFRTHLAYFVGDPNNQYYFLTLTNLLPGAIEITHLWYEDEDTSFHILNRSRQLPKRLLTMESWESWVNVKSIPRKYSLTAFEKFKARISSGDFFESSLDDQVPSEGRVPGGYINLLEIFKGD
jgi:hypothetical protein